MSKALRRIQESVAEGELTHRVHEAAAPAGIVSENGSVIRPDGTVEIVIIRPCVGKGRGKHVYEAEMLEEHGKRGHFNGWPMFIDHESPEAQRKAGGLPTSITKIGGEILESWWDPNEPAEGRFGQGAVKGRVKPSPWMVPVIEAHPRLIQASVNTFATGVKPRRTQEGTAYVVEGFAPDGSVDWVTKAGAGGKIVQVLEAWFEDGSPSHDEAIATWIRESRPAVAEAIIDTPNHGDRQEDDEVDAKQLVECFNTLSDDQRREVAEAVLSSDAGTTAIQSVVDERLAEVMPQAMEAAASEIERGTLAKVDERLGKGDLLKDARAKLEESGLPEVYVEDAYARLSEGEFKPVEADDKGEGAKTAREVMEAAVEEQVQRCTRLVEAAGGKVEKAKPGTRTAVTGNGGGGGDDEREHVSESDDEGPGEWGELLQEAGIDGEDAYGLKKPTEEPAA